MAAAVTDFSPRTRSADKLEKASMKSLDLELTPDILKEVGGRRNRPIIVGFAAEAGDRRDRARDKLLRKRADIIVFNDITQAQGGFEADTNRIVIIEENAETEFPILTKEEAAQAVLDRVADVLEK
jgi:phosphopantothenoylcysteine decarboxylase/phosphopantothenate--cysteine ligase